MLSLSDERRLAFGQTIAAVALLTGMLFSFPLWTTQRGYPLLPLVAGVALPMWAHVVLVLTLCLLLVAAACGRKMAAALSVIVLVILVLADQSRLQPWVLVEAGMLAVFACEQEPRRALGIGGLLLASVYIFSGLQKINPGFFVEVFPWVYGEQSVLALGVPLVEVFIGVGLLTGRYRRVALGLAVAMHLGILLALGPLGRSENSVIWPWNVAMIAFVVVMFYNVDLAWRTMVIPRSVTHGCVFVLFSVLPLLSFVGLWDKYLSFALYSGNTQSATIAVEEGEIDVLTWSLSSMNVPPYAEERTYWSLFAEVCTASPTAVLTIVEPLNWRLVHDSRQFECQH